MTDRQERIVELLEQRGACTYQELTELLDVSAMTVRRDVDQLASRGKVIKILGGVQKANAPEYFYETTLRSRLSEQGQEKSAIASQALELLSSAGTVFLDGSSTCLRLAGLIGRHCKGLTVVTNSPLVCLDVCRTNDNTVIEIGGRCDFDSMSFVGPETEAGAAKYFVDIAFVSTKGFIPTEGTFESSVATFRIKQIVARQCRELVLMVDHTKFGRRALCKVLDASEIHTVITDDRTPSDIVEQLEKAGKRVLVSSVADECIDRSARCLSNP